MAKWINIASLLFENERCRGETDAREAVLVELREKMQKLSGTGLDLLVLSEAVELINHLQNLPH